MVTKIEKQNVFKSSETRQEAELQVLELKRLRLWLGLSAVDRVRNEQIRGTEKDKLTDKLREVG